MRQCRGFTLIELLVVIAIIAILAAILFPVFARAKAKATQTQCLSNIKQIMLACKMYAEDYEDRAPARWFPDYGDKFAGVDYIGFQTQIIDYIGAREMFRCPSIGKGVAHYTLPATSYATNDCHFSTWGEESLDTAIANPAQNRWYRFSEVSSPAQTFFLGEITDWAIDWGTGRIYCPFCAPSYWPELSNNITPDNGLAMHHNTGSILAFCDGHAKWMSRAMALRGLQAGATNLEIRDNLILWGHEVGGSWQLGNY